MMFSKKLTPYSISSLFNCSKETHNYNTTFNPQVTYLHTNNEEEGVKNFHFQLCLIFTENYS